MGSKKQSEKTAGSEMRILEICQENGVVIAVDRTIRSLADGLARRGFLRREPGAAQAYVMTYAGWLYLMTKRLPAVKSAEEKSHVG